MIAQLSHRHPRGSPPSSSIGVRCAGSFARKSGSLVLPQTSTSSKSSPAARTKIRAERLFTLGVRMFSVLAAMGPPRLSLDELRQSTLLNAPRIAAVRTIFCAPRSASSTKTGSGGSCCVPRAPRADEDVGHLLALAPALSVRSLDPREGTPMAYLSTPPSATEEQYRAMNLQRA